MLPDYQIISAEWWTQIKSFFYLGKLFSFQRRIDIRLHFPLPFILSLLPAFCLCFSDFLIFLIIIENLSCSLLTGAPALTSRNFLEKDFVQVAEFLDQGFQITSELTQATGKHS